MATDGPIAADVAAQLCLIAAQDDVYRSFVTVLSDEAMETARRLDRLPPPHGLLHGMTVAIKDNIDVAAVPTTAASPVMAGHVARSDAAIVERLRRAGAIVIGKANMHEWAIGPTGQSTKAPAAVNAWNPLHLSGGSSSGSGVAVARGFATGAIGTDTGGSVRLPAAFNGVSGLRPTVGLVSCQGSLPVSAPLDTLGPMARSALDVAKILQAIAGHDRRDPWSADRAPDDYLAQIDAPVRGLRIGVPRGWFFDKLAPGMGEAAEAAVAALERQGARIVDIDLPEAGQALALVAFNVVLVDAFEVHRERIAARRDLYGEDVLSRLDLGAAVSGPDYAAALRWMERWRQTLRGVFQDVDAILTPTTPGPAPAIAADGAYHDKIRAIARNTYPWAAWAGPSVSIPCGFADGMPLGLQLTGRWFDEATILRIAHAFQRVTDHHLARPGA